MIDLHEPMFTMQGNSAIRIGYCALVKNDQVIYAGPIPFIPPLTDGCELFMHPTDCKRLDAHMKELMKKQVN